MEQIRCFVAIELPEELKLELAKLQSQLKAASRASVKWVDTKGIHLTLKFLGNVEPKRIPTIVGAVAQASRGITPFRLELAGTGVFPGQKQPRVAWVGLKGDVQTVVRLQEQLEAALVALGFLSEARSFTPHITLGRVRPEGQSAEKQNLAQAIILTRFEAATPLDVKAVSLIKSQLTPSGAIYTRLAEVKL
jgi:2'-5' RNA ligase